MQLMLWQNLKWQQYSFGKLWTTIVLVALALLVIWGLLRAFEHRQVFHPTARILDHPGVLKCEWEDVTLRTEDGVQLHAWLLRTPPEAPFADWVVLLCHGNAGNITYRCDNYELLLDLGLNILTFDYRGYGKSHGRPSEAGTYLDAAAAYQYLRSQGFPPDRIILLGESLGGGVVAHLALHQPAAALVLHNSFTSIPDLGAELFPWLPVRSISRIHYPTADRLSQIDIPVMIMHSPEDHLIPFHHAEKNFQAANEPKFLVRLAGGHNHTFTRAAREYQEGFKQLMSFLATLP